MSEHFPQNRMRRMRRNSFTRDMMAEHQLSSKDLIYPMFVLEGTNRTEKIPSMPGIERMSIDLLIKEAQQLVELGIPAMALFPVTAVELKSLCASEAFNPQGLAQKAVRAIKQGARHCYYYRCCPRPFYFTRSGWAD